MINTLCACTVQCTVQVRVQYRVHITVQSVSLFFAQLNFIGGGACTLYSAECIIIFCSAQFYLEGLKPPKP